MKKLITILYITGFTLLSFNVNSQGCAEPTSDEGVTVFGFLQPQFDAIFDGVHYEEWGPFGSPAPSSTFRFNRMRFGVMGNIPYDFSYYALLETSPFFNQEGQMFLIDAFITYNRLSFAKVSVGRFKKPLGLELLTACSGLHTIRRSEFVNELTGPTNRDMGIMILGGTNTSKISYRVALMNSSNQGLNNDDQYFDTYGRVDLRPMSMVTIGGSFMYGKSVAETPGDPDNKRFRYGVDLDFTMNSLRIQSEYMFADNRGMSSEGGGCDGGPVTWVKESTKKYGFFIMGMYNITPQIQPVVKFEQFDPKVADDNSMRQTTTLGLNYFFNDWTRLQVNYLYRAEDPKEIDNDAFLAQIQVKF